MASLYLLYGTFIVELNLQSCNRYRSVITPEPAYSDKLMLNVPILIPPFWYISNLSSQSLSTWCLSITNFDIVLIG